MRSIQVQAAYFGRASDGNGGQQGGSWRLRNLLRAPHRLAFFAGLMMLVAIGAWWGLMQMGRTGWLALPAPVLPLSLVHSSLMVWGFFPILFSGFLFTAGPRWLNVPAPVAKDIALPLGLQMVGWLLWLAGSFGSRPVALTGLGIAAAGLLYVTFLFFRLTRQSHVSDQIHARLIAAACLLGCLSLGGLFVSVTLGQPEFSRACVLTALWGFVTVVFVVVSHRMIPFFTSSAMPMVAQWKPFWILWLMVATLLLKASSAWMEMLLWPTGQSPWWLVALGAAELTTGAVLVWIAFVWGLVQSLKNRLLAMLHIGFLWLGISTALQGLAHGMAYHPDAPIWSLSALHAATLGCLLSLTMAMVTRVSCGHSGRALVADSWTWTCFWILQVTTVLRVAAGLDIATPQLMPASAMLFLATIVVWAGRLMVWYGLPRADGKAG